MFNPDPVFVTYMVKLVASMRVSLLTNAAYFYVLFLMFPLVGCGPHLYHIVERGETLYSVSWMYGHDYQKVAQWNHLKSPFVIKDGQRLRVAGLPDDPVDHQTSPVDLEPVVGTKSVARINRAVDTKSKTPKRDGVHKFKLSKPDKTGSVTNYVPATNSVTEEVGRNDRTAALKWQWPTDSGKLIQPFDAKDPGKRGLDISGMRGQSVFSASSGRVVYSGSGLPRYGKLIIVKHNDMYLSAYAHNKTLRVKQGERVIAGQHIADMGSSGTRRIKLHFEIRRNGKAVDPLRLLPKPGPVSLN